MDGQRFDRLTRALASGASRRSLLKGLLGIGGAAGVASVAADQSHARRRGGVTSPTTPAPTTTSTPAPPDCNGTQCGLDCCDLPQQCCDGECCPAGYDCLTYHFPEGPYVEEETCCRADLVCDTDTVKCCAAGEECCVRDDISYCIPVGGCCFDEECPSNPSTCEIGVCDPSTGACSLRFECTDVEECCPRDGAGHCIPVNSECCQDSECEGFPPCVPAICEIGTWQCRVQNAPDGTECDDSDPCTLDDRCFDGVCLGTVIPCPDGEVCVDGACCAPECDGLSCLGDGCAGTCECEEGRVCPSNGSCAVPCGENAQLCFDLELGCDFGCVISGIDDGSILVCLATPGSGALNCAFGDNAECPVGSACFGGTCAVLC